MITLIQSQLIQSQLINQSQLLNLRSDALTKEEAIGLWCFFVFYFVTDYSMSLLSTGKKAY